MDPNETVAIVVDNGGYTCKAGLAGDDAPRSVFPSVVGKPRDMETQSSDNDKHIGDNAQAKRDTLSLSYPIQNGVVTDWDLMEAIWRHAFTDELHIKTEDHPVLLTEPPFNPNANREKMTEIMFETFNVPAYHVAIPAHLAVYANGRVSSLVYDCGEGVSHVVLVYEGYTIPHATQRINIAGSDVTTNLARFLGARGNSFTTSSELEIVRGIKERLGYIATDYEAELLKSESDCNEVFTLPDGKEITVGKERFKATECIFDPALVGIDAPGAHELINKCLEKCDIDTRKDLFCNIIMSGGSTMFPGFSDRMKKELGQFVPPSARFNVISPPERKYSVWIGGSILTSLSMFTHLWVTREMYEESGPAVVHMKCLRFQDSKT